MQTNLIGETAIFLLNESDPPEDRIEVEGQIRAVWADAGVLWLAVQAEGMPMPIEVTARRVEIKGWA